MSEARRKVLYGDAAISRRKAVISGDPRQVFPRRAAIPAVNRSTCAFSTSSSFVSVGSTTRGRRVSHLIGR